MVQILPPPTNVGTQLGQALSQGLQQGLPMGIQRGMLQKALGGLENLPQGSSPFQLASQLIQATAGIPGAERYVGQLFPLLLAQMQGQSVQGVPPAPGQGVTVPSLPGAPSASTPASGVPVSPQGVQVPQAAAPSAERFLQQANTQLAQNLPPDIPENLRSLPEPAYTPDLFKGTLEPTELGMGPIPPQYTPEQIQQIAKEDAAIYGAGNSPRVQMMEQYNEASRRQMNDILNAAQAQGQVAGIRSEQQQRFRNFLEERTGIKDPALLSIAERLSNQPRYRNVANEALRADMVTKEANKIFATLNSFESDASVRPHPFLKHPQYENKIKSLHSKVQPLIKEGLRDEAKNALAQQGWSESEMAQILNPLSKETKSSIEKLPKFGFVQPETGKASPEQLARAEKEISRFFKTGKVDPKNPDVVQPGTSLINLRNAFLKRNLPAQDFDRAVSNLIEQGKITLDPYQQTEFQQLSQRPTEAYSVWEMLFGPQ